MTPPSPPKTLVVQPLPGVGDAIWHLHVIESIARASPRGAVSALTKRKSAAETLFEEVGFIDEVLWLERNPGRHDGVAGLFRLARELRPHRFETACILHPSPRYALAALWAGIPVRRGYGVGAQGLFLTDRVRLPRDVVRRHPIDKATAWLALQGVPLARPEPAYPVTPERRDRAVARFLHAPRPWYGFGIGSAGTPKLWPADCYGTLARAVVERTEGSVFLMGAEWERMLAERITTGAGPAAGRVHTMLPRSISELAAVTAALDRFVGNDSGLLNLAAALAVPSLGLFGASYPLTHSRHIDAVVPDDGIVIEGDGMGRIPVAAVVAKLEALGWLGEALKDNG